MQTRDATTLLTEWRDGNRSALDELFPLVYEELRRRAHRALQGEDEGHTLTTTALVHEAYLRLLDVTRVRWQDRSHFLALAATAMRRVLVDHARRHKAAKRGGGREAEQLEPSLIPLDPSATLSAERAEQMLALDAALQRLFAVHERMGRTVEMRFFGGMTIEETAEALEVATSTVKLDWQKAKAWLYQELERA
jgi:RNA polymerase sigma factor (TIGR02999 family)